MKNLEIKARLENAGVLRKRLAALGAQKQDTTRQVDTYFTVPKGRLKLRVSAKDTAYLVYYERGETTQERWSRWQTYAVSDPRACKKLHEEAFGIKVVVDKKRTVYSYQNAQIHVDIVKGLGSFIEVEVEATNGDAQAKALMAKLLEAFEVGRADLIRVSYSDLMLIAR